MLAEQLAGSLPPVRLGELTLQRITAEVQDLYRGTTELRAGEARAHDVDVDLGGGRRLVGTVSDVCGNRLVRVGYSRLRAKQRLSAWVDLLALSAALPDENWTGHTVGKGSAGAQRATAGPLDHTAVDRLRELVELRDLGLCRPLAAPLATAHAWAEAHARELRGDDRSPAHAAAREWVTDPNNSCGIQGEDADAVARAGLRGARAAVPAARRRAGDPRLADLGAAGDRRREGGAAVSASELSGVVHSATDHFDICGPLPTGTTLLEASAGTGKTWTIGALVARYVAEGEVRLEQMLVVTFGRAASQELRERVRAQLVEAEQALAEERAAGAPPQPRSDLIALLLDCDDAERRRRHRRVAEALAGFDAATIATTHQFCQLVLDSLGVAGDTDASARLVEDLDELLGEVVDDLYLRAFACVEDAPAVHPRRGAGDRPAPRSATRRRGSSRPARTPATLPGRGWRFADAVRDEMDRRKRRLGVLSYDDLLSQLADALEADDAPARARMRQRWRIVLVDEFQDTDPVQWQVLDRAFSGHATMVLIGDPKQAIYAFRGGDVTTYLQAAATAGTRQHPRRQLAQRRPAARVRCRPCSAAPSSATSGSSSTTSAPTTTGAGWPGRRRRRRSGCGW